MCHNSDILVLWRRVMWSGHQICQDHEWRDSGARADAGLTLIPTLYTNSDRRRVEAVCTYPGPLGVGLNTECQGSKRHYNPLVRTSLNQSSFKVRTTENCAVTRHLWETQNIAILEFTGQVTLIIGGRTMAHNYFL